MKWLQCLYAGVVAAAVSLPAAATDRFFHDCHAISPNGRFRIDAKSPDNAGDRPRPFASSFTYTLTDTTTKKTMWTRKQPMTREKASTFVYSTEGSPLALFVNDAGLVAAHLSGDSLLFLEPASGRKRAEVEILGAFPKAEQDEFVSHSTAGPIWTQESDWFFLEVPVSGRRPGGVYFVVRPYWNQRLIVDTASGLHVELGSYRDAASPAQLTDASEPIRELLAATIVEEAGRSITALTNAAERLKSGADYRVYWGVRAGLHTAGFLKLAQAEPDLRKLEKGLDDLGERFDDLQSEVREALRAIGSTPAAGYGVRLYPLISKGLYTTHDTDHPYRAQVPVEERTSNAGKVVAGMSAAELTDLLGCPDAELSFGCYDYDIDGPDAYTLRVVLDRSNQNVVKVTTIKPFAFFHDTARMQGY